MASAGEWWVSAARHLGVTSGPREAMRILILSTWFPYPLSQGSKIRAYHLISALARDHSVALISYEDTPVPANSRESMARICQMLETVPESPFESKPRVWPAWLSLKPSSVATGYSPRMSACARQTAALWKPDVVLALTFVTAPYALEIKGVRHALDVDNLLAPMLYESYQRTHGRLPRLRRYVAAQKFRRYESQLFRQFDQVFVVSPRDVAALQGYVPLRPSQIGVVPNGVNIDYIRPNGHPEDHQRLVFNGALTYGPNYDAMEYFLAQVYPIVRRHVPGARLCITGATKSVPLHRLQVDESVAFTGYLEDVRPTVAGAAACVVPLRQGAGTRLKILEAMALGTPVVSTSKGAEGLEVEAGKHLLIADRPDDFAAQTIRLLQDQQLRTDLSAAARQLVQERYDWTRIGRHLSDLLGDPSCNASRF